MLTPAVFLPNKASVVDHAVERRVGNDDFLSRNGQTFEVI